MPGQPLAKGSRSALWLGLGLAAFLLLCGVLAWLQPGSPPPARLLPSPPPLPDTPLVSTGVQYAGSANCQPCHEVEYQSWSKTYHSTMTRVPAKETLLSPWTTRELELGRERYLLEATPEGYFVTLQDPDLRAKKLREKGLRAGQELPRNLPRERRQVVLLTGSHHYEAYWVRGDRGNELWQVPFVYHFESQRFLPRGSVFLQPPDDPPAAPRWNSNCIQCHSVAGQPRHDVESDQFQTRVAEHGIACEACHGPGAAHIALRTQHAEVTRDQDPIVDLRELSAARASDVCGQCHAYFLPTHEQSWWEVGYTASYVPGRALDDSRQLLALEVAEDEFPELSTTLSSIFHSDGTMRVGGRELNAMRASACYQRAQGDKQLGCISCHQLHGGSRSDQLSEKGEANAQCTQCHRASRFDTSSHTRHAYGSQGSRCVNCHMPMTSYALLKGIRTHRITRFGSTGDGVNACVLCHQTEPRDFGSDLLAQWTQEPVPFGAALAAEATSTPRAGTQAPAALAVSLLAGDAAARALAAFHLGRNPNRPNQERVTTDFRSLLLTQALLDPYAAVRYIAGRALQRNPQLSSLPFDFVAPFEVRRAQAQAFLSRAQSLAPPPASADEARRTLRLPSGRLDTLAVGELVMHRDETPVRIAE